MSELLPAELVQLRERIEAIDQGLIKLIAERVDAARAVGRAKKRHELPILDPTREAAVVRRATELARTAGLDEEDTREIFWHIIGLCRRAQLEGHANPSET